MITELLNTPITYGHHLVAMVLLTPVIAIALLISWRIRDKRKNKK